MDTASQPAPPRRRTPRRTYTATRASHPNYSRFTCRTAELPSPLTHLWRPPAIAGAGGHAQVDSGTPYRGRGQPQGAPARLLRRPTRPSARPACPPPLSPVDVVPVRGGAGLHPGRHSPRPGSASQRRGGPGTVLPPSPAPHPPLLVASLESPLPLSRGGTPRGPSPRKEGPWGSGSPAKRRCDIQTPPRRRTGNLQPGIFLS